MKSFFSCFPKKKSKSKAQKGVKTETALITETKPNVLNHFNDEVVKHHNNLTENNIIYEINPSVVCEKLTVINAVNQEEINRDLEERLRHALSRIENVYSVLNNKKKMYILPHVVSEFKNLIDSELSSYVIRSNCLGGCFIQQASFVVNLFYLQLELLNIIQNGEYQLISALNEKFKINVMELNKYCTRSDDNNELNRLIADSIMVFGWLCCFSNPAGFVQNVLDGSVMTAARWVNDQRYAKYSDWLKAWTTVLKVFSGIVTRNFEAALMWRLEGPVPMDIFKCLVQSNYSSIEDQPRPVAAKPKVVKTTAVNDISYETVTSLFDDLRSGRQKSKLKSVKMEESETVDSSSIIGPVTEEQVMKVEVIPSTIVGVQDKGVYHLKDSTWTIRGERDNPNIEITNKAADNSVSICECNDCSIQIDGTVANITIDNCANISVIIDEVAGLVCATNSSNVESQVLGRVANVELKEVTKFRLFIQKEDCEKVVIVTHKCSDIELYVSNNDGGGLELEDYDKHTVGTCCRTALVDGVTLHTSF